MFSRALLRVDAARVESVRVSAARPVAKTPSVLRDAVSGFFADRVESLGEPDFDPEMTIEVTVAEGGPTKRIFCSAPGIPVRRRCSASDTRAVFSVLRGTWSRFFEAGDGGNVARDAGSR